jgi:hypothetical protein
MDIKLRNYATHEWHLPQSFVNPNDDLRAIPRAEGGRPGVLVVDEVILEKMQKDPIMKGWFGPGAVVVETDEMLAADQKAAASRQAEVEARVAARDAEIAALVKAGG